MKVNEILKAQINSLKERMRLCRLTISIKTKEIEDCEEVLKKLQR